MRILLASIHLGSSDKADRSFVVAYVYCESHRVTVEPVHSAFEGSPVIDQLRELAADAGDQAFVKLRAYCSPPWSFDVADIH